MTYRTLLENNRRWARACAASDPEYFPRLAAEHRPHCLFISCSDARVPADVITQASPGELFVHRNVANQVLSNDPSLMAGLQYAVEALHVTDVVVCGHEGCGGVRAAAHAAVHAASQATPALVDGWVAGVRTVMRLHDDELSALPDVEAQLTRLVELNVVEQVFTLSRTPVVQRAWAAGTTLRLHGWVYGLGSGLLRDLHVTMDGASITPRAAEPLRRTG